ncbi:MAG: hypothetical protein AAB355_03195 [Patescibacteria group bacterium]
MSQILIRVFLAVAVAFTAAACGGNSGSNGGGGNENSVPPPEQPLPSEKGKLFFSSPQALSLINLETRGQNVLWTEHEKYPLGIVPVRSGDAVAFTAVNKPFLLFLSLASLSVRNAIDFSRTWGPSLECGSQPQGSFDLNSDGSIIVFVGKCSPVGQPERRGIAVMKTDGSMLWRIVAGGEGDNFKNFSPAIVGVLGDPSVFSVFFASNRGVNGEIGIWQKASPTAALHLIAQTRFTMDTYSPGMERFFSINREYNKMVYMDLVDGKFHLFVLPFTTGGAGVDIGEGRNADWGKDGHNRILYTLNGEHWTTNPDGTDKRKMVPIGNMSTPSNGGLVDGMTGAVFAVK